MQEDSNQGEQSIKLHLAPLLLLGGFAAILIHNAPSYLPLIFATLLGYLLTRYGQKIGLYIALAAIIISAIFVMRKEATLLWPLGLSLSIALSCWLLFLSRKEADAIFEEREERIAELKNQSHALEKQVRDGKLLLAREMGERQKFQALYLEKNVLIEKPLPVATVSQQLPVEQSVIVPMEEEEQEVLARHQLALLREQFEEKSQALDRTRQELFQVENLLLALQKDSEEKNYELLEEDLSFMKDLRTLDTECCNLEEQVAILEEWITILLSAKKTSRPRRSKSKEPSLPLLLQEKIEQTKGSVVN